MALQGLRWGTAAWGMGQNMAALRTWHCYCFPATTTNMYSPPVARSLRMYRTSSLCHTFVSAALVQEFLPLVFSRSERSTILGAMRFVAAFNVVF